MIVCSPNPYPHPYTHPHLRTHHPPHILHTTPPPHTLYPPTPSPSYMHVAIAAVTLLGALVCYPAQPKQPPSATAAIFGAGTYDGGRAGDRGDGDSSVPLRGFVGDATLERGDEGGEESGSVWGSQRRGSSNDRHSTHCKELYQQLGDGSPTPSATAAITTASHSTGVCRVLGQCFTLLCGTSRAQRKGRAATDRNDGNGSNGNNNGSNGSKNVDRSAQDDGAGDGSPRGSSCSFSALVVAFGLQMGCYGSWSGTLSTVLNANATRSDSGNYTNGSTFICSASSSPSSPSSPSSASSSASSFSSSSFAAPPDYTGLHLTASEAGWVGFANTAANILGGIILGVLVGRSRTVARNMKVRAWEKVRETAWGGGEERLKWWRVLVKSQKGGSTTNKGVGETYE